MSSPDTDTDRAITAGRRRVGPADLLWLTWKQHRWVLGAGAAFALALSGYLVWTMLDVTALVAQQCSGDCRFDRSTASIGLIYFANAHTAFIVMAAFALIVGLFWGAPLLAREYEQRTHIVAFTQDVTPGRWLWGKVVPLAAVAAVLAVMLGTAGDALSATLTDSFGSERFGGQFTEAAPLPQLGYALFALAVGLLSSAVLRRTLPAMASTLVVFGTVRFLVSLVRPYFLAPARDIRPVADVAIGIPPDVTAGGLIVDRGLLDAAGNQLSSVACAPPAEDAECPQLDRAVSQFFDYQPTDRLELFRAIECGIFLVLTAALLALTWWWVRRSDAA